MESDIISSEARLQSHTIYGETLESKPIASVSENGAFSSLGVTDKSIPQIIRGEK